MTGQGSWGTLWKTRLLHGSAHPLHGRTSSLDGRTSSLEPPRSDPGKGSQSLGSKSVGKNKKDTDWEMLERFCGQFEALGGAK